MEEKGIKVVTVKGRSKRFDDLGMHVVYRIKAENFDEWRKTMCDRFPDVDLEFTWVSI